jgi:hypothetical protein
MVGFGAAMDGAEVDPTHAQWGSGVTERSDSRRKLTTGSFFYVEM